LEAGQVVVVTLVVVAEAVVIERHVRQRVGGRVADAMGAFEIKGLTEHVLVEFEGAVNEKHAFGDLVGQPLFLRALRQEGRTVQFDELIVGFALFVGQTFANVVSEEPKGQGIAGRDALALGSAWASGEA
jgi:hypothetical protein